MQTSFLVLRRSLSPCSFTTRSFSSFSSSSSSPSSRVIQPRWSKFGLRFFSSLVVAGGLIVLSVRTNKKNELEKQEVIRKIFLNNEFDRQERLNLNRIAFGLGVQSSYRLIERILMNEHLSNLDLSNNAILFSNPPPLHTALSWSDMLIYLMFYLRRQFLSLIYCGLSPSEEFSFHCSFEGAASGLKELNLSSNDISDSLGARIVQGLLNAPLENLNFSANQLGLATVNSLCLLLNKGKLSRLNLHSNPLGADAIVQLLTTIKMSSSLTMLSLNSVGTSENQSAIASAIASSIKEVLMCNPFLHELDIGNCRIPSAQMINLLEGLARNSGLQVLSLDQNLLDDECSSKLAIALRENQSLECLSLMGTNIGDKTGIAIAEVLKENTWLRALALDHTRIGESTATALLSALETNQTILFISLTNTAVPPMFITQIETILEARRSERISAVYQTQMKIQSLNYKLNLLRTQQPFRSYWQYL